MATRCDWRTAGEAKLYGVSLKDRAAILPSGQTANGAFWIDQATGRFVTSTYYMAQLPEWATKFNKGPRVAQACEGRGSGFHDAVLQHGGADAGGEQL